MSDAREAVSELRANMVDVLSYLLPGGTLLVAISFAAFPGFKQSFCWRCLPGMADVTRSGWLSFLAIMTVVGAAYVAGTLLRTIDSWFGPKWKVVLNHAVREKMGDVKTALVAALPKNLEALREQARESSKDACEDDINVKLHNVADVLVRGYAPGVLLSWQERYEWLQNLYGGLAWALWIGAAVVVISRISPASWSDLLLLMAVVPAALRALVRELGRGWTPPEGDGDARNPWETIDSMLSILLVLVLALALALKGLWLFLLVLIAAALGDELKRRQRSLREKQYNIMWHGALLVLRPVGAEPATQPAVHGD